MYYKIHEVAQKLGVERVILYDKLISHSQEMQRYIKKNNGITYISEDGVEYLSSMMSSVSSHSSSPVKSEPVWRINKQDIEARVEMFSNDTKAGKEKTSEHQTIEIASYEEAYEHDADVLRKRISEKRNTIVQFDGELKRMNEAVISYHKILEEDMDWLWNMEEKAFQKMYEQQGVGETRFVNPFSRLMRK